MPAWPKSSIANRTPSALIVPDIAERDPALTAEVIRLRGEGASRAQICNATGLSESQLGRLIARLLSAGRIARATTRHRRALVERQVREVHKAYMDGESIEQLARGAYVSVRCLYQNFETLGLPRRANNVAWCERALQAADQANTAKWLSWRGYEAWRAQRADLPSATTIAAVVGCGSWIAAKRAAGVR